MNTNSRHKLHADFSIADNMVIMLGVYGQRLHGKLVSLLKEVMGSFMQNGYLVLQPTFQMHYSALGSRVNSDKARIGK